jgi:hypothetical protein
MLFGVPAFLFLFAVSGLVAGEPAQLVPFRARSSRSLQSRAWKRELAPKDVVDLHYGPSESRFLSFHFMQNDRLLDMAAVPSTSLKFAAHPGTPIVILEDIDYVLDSIVCHSSSDTTRTEVELNFRTEEVYIAALTLWSTYPSFILVTSHLTCNLDDRRGAWL